MESGTMSSKHKMNNKRGAKMKKKSITLWMPVLLAVVWLAAPVAATAAEKHAGTVLRQGAGNLVLAPPNTSVSEELGPKDPPVTVSVKGWYCITSADNLSKMSRDPSHAYLEDVAGGLLSANTNKKNDSEFWYEYGKGYGKGGIIDIAWKFNPAIGKSQTKSAQHCYTSDELSNLRQRAVIWAKFILSNK